MTRRTELGLIAGMAVAVAVAVVLGVRVLVVSFSVQVTPKPLLGQTSTTYDCGPAQRLLGGSDFDSEGADDGKCLPAATIRVDEAFALFAVGAAIVVVGARGVRRRRHPRQPHERKSAALHDPSL